MKRLHIGVLLILASCSVDRDVAQPAEVEIATRVPPISAAPDVMPPGWRTINAKYFEFQLPPGLNHNAKGVAFDSFARVYESESMNLGFDYGRYSDDFDLTYSTGLTHIVRSNLVIDGHPATIVSYRVSPENENTFVPAPHYTMAVHFPEVAQSSEGVIKFTMHCHYKSEHDHAVVERILKSIRFLK